MKTFMQTPIIPPHGFNPMMGMQSHSPFFDKKQTINNKTKDSMIIEDEEQ